MEIFDYPIINISNLNNDHNFKQFHVDGYGNFSHFRSSPALDSIFIVSNGNEILRLAKNNLTYINKISVNNHCKQETCEKVKIDLVHLGETSDLLWYCTAHKSFMGMVSSEQPICKMVYLDNFSIAGVWNAGKFLSNDFQHRSIQSVIGDYTYNGLFIDRELKIYKNSVSSSKNEIEPISLPRYFLKAPGDFITSFQNNNSVYFLYLETDFVCGFKDEKLVTRLTRLCTNDYGNDRKEFSAFGKLDVECKQSNKNRAIPSYIYRVATNGLWLPLTRQLVVTFVNRNEEVESSAICVYSILTIEEGFNSDLKSSSDNPTFLPSKNYQNICDNLNKGNELYSSDSLNILFKNFPLRRKITSSEAIYRETQSEFSELASEESNWTSNRRIILFVSTLAHGRTSILEILLQPYFCILRKHFLQESVMLLKTEKDNNKLILYIGTPKRLIKIPMDTCWTYNLENQCSMSKNPYCFWNSNFKKCDYISSESDFSLVFNLSTYCSQFSMKPQQVPLKLWIPCKLVSLTDESKPIGTCNCSKTIVSGSNERKISVSTDCKVNGDWTPFSAWSDCSVTCGIGSQIRVRACENPRSQRGGNPCNGEEREIRMCNPEKKCEALKTTSDWTEWSSCSKTCGFSFQTRTRQCLSENCPQILLENRLCNKKPCEYTVSSEWTPWSKFDATTSSKTRFQFQCTRKYEHEPRNLSFKYIFKYDQPPNCSSEDCLLKHENKMVIGKMQDWSAWSDCNNNCDITEWTRRTRSCSGNTCLGSTTDYKPCSTIPCQSVWSCWSEWTGCPTSCETKGTGVKTRQCVLDKNKSLCKGQYSETSDCDLIPCHNSYSQWSHWSSCKRGGVLTRSRTCLSSRQCLFPLLQSKPCYQALINKPEEYSFLYMIVSGLVGLVLGILAAGVICYIWWRCTMNVITSTFSESMRLNTSGITGNDQSIYESQSLHTLPDIYGTHRQRTPSAGDNYILNSSPNRYPEQSSSTFNSFFYPRHPPLHEEHMNTHI